MLHPVGPQPPSVYWRRRLLLVASLAVLVVLVALTARAVLGGGGGSGGGGAPAAQDHSIAPTSTHSTAPPSSGGSLSGADASSQPEVASTPAGSTAAASSSPMPAPCTPAQLSVQAVVGKAVYAVGDEPVLTLQVTNTGTAACVQDVADSQILLRVYNGASRVWGSHDCKVEPGVQDRTLEPGKAAGFSIVWSGLSSQPSCAGTRQRVGAGTYTLYASLSGHEGKAAQFTIK